mmetsp:Transcript_65465/g.95903  ORF Transcript_65465/g.95903 Transcript_65465/m.95903 type:complete len:263 (-) Transcript_65465:1-789(-)
MACLYTAPCSTRCNTLQHAATRCNTLQHRPLLVGLGGHAKIALARGSLHLREALGEFLGGLFVRQRWHHHAAPAIDPISGGSYRVVGSELERVDDTQHFVEVTTSCGRVEDLELELLIGRNHKHSPARERHTSRIFFVRIDHAELDRKITLLVSNDGIVKLRHTLGGLDVLDPALVGRGVIARQSDGLYAPFLELWLQLGDAAQLGGADGCVVVWVRKHHGPTVAHPLMELDRPHRGFGLKVGHNVAEVHAGHLAQPCWIAT